MHGWIGLGSLLVFAVHAPGVAAEAARPITSTTFTSATVTQGDTAARIAKLKRSFECIDVGNDGGFVCSMKDGMMGSLVRKRLEPVVTSSGTLFLRSVYRDRDWIYHDHVVVRVGDTELRTAPQPSTSRDVSRREIRRTSSLGNRNRGRDDYVSELVSHRGADGDAIIQAIIGAGKATVTMQLAGGPRSYDKKLSDDEKRLFSEAHELASLLRARTQARP